MREQGALIKNNISFLRQPIEKAKVLNGAAAQFFHSDEGLDDFPLPNHSNKFVKRKMLRFCMRLTASPVLRGDFDFTEERSYSFFNIWDILSKRFEVPFCRKFSSKKG